MFKPLTIISFLAAPMVVSAQDYGTQELRQTFATVSLDNIFGGATLALEVIVRPLEAGGYVEFNCYEQQPDACWTVRYVEFANAVAWGTADPSAPMEDTLGALIPVETPTRVGGAVFPLRDGAVFEWEETWRSEEFDADYEMTLTVSCCSAPISSSVEVSDDLWVFEFDYVNAGDVGDPHEGTLTYYYDAALGVMVNQRSAAAWADEQAFVNMSTLTDFTKSR